MSGADRSELCVAGAGRLNRATLSWLCTCSWNASLVSSVLTGIQRWRMAWSGDHAESERRLQLQSAMLSDERAWAGCRLVSKLPLLCISA